MIVAIHQPNYLPWLGYFHKIKSADIFVFLDNVQIPGKSFANRCMIKGKNGEKVMLSVPVKKTKGVVSTYQECIPDYSLRWQTVHLNKIKDAYCKSAFFEKNIELVESLVQSKYEDLSSMNIALITALMRVLKISTKV